MRADGEVGLQVFGEDGLGRGDEGGGYGGVGGWWWDGVCGFLGGGADGGFQVVDGVGEVDGGGAGFFEVV